MQRVQRCSGCSECSSAVSATVQWVQWVQWAQWVQGVQWVQQCSEKRGQNTGPLMVAPPLRLYSSVIAETKCGWRVPPCTLAELTKSPANLDNTFNRGFLFRAFGCQRFCCCQILPCCQHMQIYIHHCNCLRRNSWGFSQASSAMAFLLRRRKTSVYVQADPTPYVLCILPPRLDW
jgi:hypothetical protein